MDMSYLFQAALTILGFATKLETFAVWQAADPALDWFPGQLDEFTQACTVRGVTGQMIYPMLLRWKRTQHWNLIRETTVYNSRSKDVPLTRSFHRVERPDGIPLGLACQYHLHALKRGQVRLR